MRTYDIEKISRAVQTYQKEIVGLDLEDWLSNENNIALINENEDIALFEHQEIFSNTVCGHYFFFSRGKEAVKAALSFLEEIFSNEYSVKVILGITPLDNKGALWMNRHLGFKEHGEIRTVIGKCKMVMMTKEQWKDRTRERNLRRK